MPMVKAVTAENEHIGDFEVDKFPDECPICKKGNEFVPKYAFYKPDESAGFDSRLQVVFRCPRQSCQVMFFAFYTNTYHRPPQMWFFNKFGFIESIEQVKFPELIDKLSKRFIRIYYQANMADANGLDEIRGMAYGKALEFLIKDYLIYLNPKNKASIKSELKIARLIDKIDDGDIQTVADRASWLRNDEAHYERVWKKENIDSLKDLIDLTVQHINRAEMTKKYKKKMPGKVVEAKI